MKTTHDQPINVTLIGVEIRQHAIAHANTEGWAQRRWWSTPKPTLSIPSKISTVVGLACKKNTEMHVQSIWPQQQCSVTKQHYTILRTSCFIFSLLQILCLQLWHKSFIRRVCTNIPARVIPSQIMASGEMKPRPTNTVYRTQFTLISALKWKV